MSKEKYQEDSQVKDKTTTLRTIVVYNDDVNSFDHVINCFMNILGHTFDESLVEAYTIHNEGKCDVKSGSYDELEPYALALLNQKLSAKIE
jgi:ATP-dependent Clp protease adaptor protein ClpS